MKVNKIKVFKIFKIFKSFFRRKASPSIDSSGAKPPNFSQLQRQKILTLTLIENAGHSPAFIYEAEGFVLKRFKRFKMIFFCNKVNTYCIFF